METFEFVFQRKESDFWYYITSLRRIMSFVVRRTWSSTTKNPQISSKYFWNESREVRIPTLTYSSPNCVFFGNDDFKVIKWNKWIIWNTKQNFTNNWKTSSYIQLTFLGIFHFILVNFCCNIADFKRIEILRFVDWFNGKQCEISKNSAKL